MFIYLPTLLFLSIGWYLNDVSNLMPIAVMAVLALGNAIFRIRELQFNVRTQLILFLLFITYAISAFSNNVPIVSALDGNYQRRFGLFYFLSIYLLFVITSSMIKEIDKFYTLGLRSLIALIVFYGSLQTLNLDPLPWINDLKAVQLTLGNPNFAGALIGMTSALPMSRIIQKNQIKSKIFWTTILIVLIALANETKSLQAFLVLFTSSLTVVYLFISNNKRTTTKFRKFKSFGIVSFFASSSIFWILSSQNFMSIKNRFFFEGSVYQRIDYWRTGIEMFKDNWILGVGPDQFQKHSSLYRTSEQVLRDGDFVIPDRAHNVIIDHFANGGLFAGSLWILFCVYIFKIIIENRRNNFEDKKLTSFCTLSGLWAGYFVQSLLSPDNILLSALGIMSAGFLVAIGKTHAVENRDLKRANREKFKIDVFYARIILISLLLFSFVFWFKVIANDSEVKRILSSETLDSQRISRVINSWAQPRNVEKLIFASSQADSNCDFVPKFADQLLELDERNSQAWYFKAICANQKSDFRSALEYVDKALNFDPLNQTFLIGKTKLAISANEKATGLEVLEVLKMNFPQNSEIPILESSLNAII